MEDSGLHASFPWGLLQGLLPEGLLLVAAAEIRALVTQGQHSLGPLKKKPFN